MGLSLGPEVLLRPGNGYCRSEGVVAVLLTKKSLARRVYATILNAGTNTDGCKEQGGLCRGAWGQVGAGAGAAALSRALRRRDLPLWRGPGAAHPFLVPVGWSGP